MFHRIFVQGNAQSPRAMQASGFGFTCEITYGPNKPLPCDGDELIELCVKDARRVGFIREDDAVICGNVVDMPYAYVVYDHARPKNIAIIRQWLTQHDIVLVGRYSEWEYYNSDHAFLAGKRGADEVRKLQAEAASAAVSGGDAAAGCGGEGVGGGKGLSAAERAALKEEDSVIWGSEYLGGMGVYARADCCDS